MHYLITALCHTALLCEPTSYRLSGSRDACNQWTCKCSSCPAHQRGPVPDTGYCYFQQPISLQLRDVWESWGVCLHKVIWKRRPANAYLLRNWKPHELISTGTHLFSKSTLLAASWIRSITFSPVPVCITVRPEWAVLLNLIKYFVMSTLASNFHVNPLLNTVKWCLKYSLIWLNSVSSIPCLS